jgi:hypothetical protein
VKKATWLATCSLLETWNVRFWLIERRRKFIRLPSLPLADCCELLIRVVFSLFVQTKIDFFICLFVICSSDEPLVIDGTFMSVRNRPRREITF